MRRRTLFVGFAVLCTILVLMWDGQFAVDTFADEMWHSLELAHNIQAEASVLVEYSTGRILFSQNADVRMYPASTTKLLTAMVAYNFLDLDTVVTIGAEINNMPAGFSTGLHVYGEAITVRMLLKALIIRSSNEAGRVLALETIRTIDGRRNMPYQEAKPRFASLMNDMARDIGVSNSNFNNPYGLHSDMHFSTALDLAMIAKAFSDNHTLMEISAMQEFEGDGLEGMYIPNANVRNYTLINTNLMLPGAAFAHPYIFGGRTGFTTPAGWCFVGIAYHNGLRLISVVLNSTESSRWADTRLLLDYGFFNYSFKDVATQHEVAKVVTLENPRLGDTGVIDIVVAEGHQALLSFSEYAVLERELIFDPLFVSEVDYGDNTVFRAPIEQGAQVGTVVYKSGGEIVFSAGLIVLDAVYARTFDSDMDYYMEMIIGNIFTRRSLPYWFGIIGTLFGLVWMFYALSMRRRMKREDNWYIPKSYKGRNKY